VTTSTERIVSEVPGFDEVFEECAPFVWRITRRLGVPAKDVPDVSQEVFLVVLRKLPSYEPRASVKSWVYGIAAKVVQGYRRRACNRHEQLGVEVPEQSGPASQERQITAKRDLERLFAALETLDDEKREVFVLYELEEWSMSRVAETLGCPLSTVYSRLQRAREIVERHFLSSGPAGGAP